MDDTLALDPFHPGSRPGFGTKTALVILLDNLHLKLDRGNLPCGPCWTSQQPLTLGCVHGLECGVRLQEEPLPLMVSPFVLCQAGCGESPLCCLWGPPCLQVPFQAPIKCFSNVGGTRVGFHHRIIGLYEPLKTKLAGLTFQNIALETAAPAASGTAPSVWLKGRRGSHFVATILYLSPPC